MHVITGEELTKSNAPILDAPFVSYALRTATRQIESFNCAMLIDCYSPICRFLAQRGSVIIVLRRLGQSILNKG